MLIKLIVDTELENEKHFAGEIVNVVDEIANQLVKTGAAENHNPESMLIKGVSHSVDFLEPSAIEHRNIIKGKKNK